MTVLSKFGKPAALLLALSTLLGACSRKAPTSWQGYLEGEFVYVASPLAGRLEKLSVARGTRVEAGAPLFVLESAAELAAQDEASDQARAAEAKLEDLRKGSRPTELAALDARLGQARAAAELSRIDLERETNLYQSRAISESDFDRARLTHEENVRAVNDLEAQRETAQLGGRSDAIDASEAEVRAARAALAKADWSVAQKAQASPCAALVYDTLYREGEFVAAGNPVVTLLPPGNIKVRFFVPEAGFGQLKAGDRIQVAVPGLPEPAAARISYLSPEPEYTPPVLYNEGNRSKLVFMIEARFENAEAARDYHPGQPVDVTLAP